MIKSLRKCDIFITHSWRVHPEWQRVCELFDQVEEFTWRNFSVPWHDPALHPSRDKEFEMIKEVYVTQIEPADVCIVVLDLLSARSSERWIHLAISVADEFKIPLVGLYLDPNATNLLPQNVLNKFRFIDTLSAEAAQRIVDHWSTPAEFSYL